MMTDEQLMLAISAGGFLAAMGAMEVLPRLWDGSFAVGVFQRQRSHLGVAIAGRWIPDEARLRHTHIVGATGSGKTVLLEQLIYRDLERGLGAIIIDPKGDREFFGRIKSFCQKLGREQDLKLLSATYRNESVVWNPCRLGTAPELQSKFYNAATFSEPHYAKACELALLRVFNELDQESVGFSLTQMVAALDRLSRNGKDETMAGLFLDLGNLAEGEWGELLGCSQGLQREEVSLLDLTRNNQILFVDLPTESQAVQSSRVGKLLLQEITLISGMRKLYPEIKSGRPFSVFVDEFDAFATPAFATFLNKGRSSDFMIHLAHQTLSDLKRVSEEFMGQVMGNMNVRFIFRQDDPDDAEKWSRFFGTLKTVKHTYQTENGSKSGMGSVRDVQEFRVPPDRIKELQTGRCIFSMKTTKRAPQSIQIPYGAKVMQPRVFKKPPFESQSKDGPLGRELEPRLRPALQPAGLQLSPSEKPKPKAIHRPTQSLTERAQECAEAMKPQQSTPSELTRKYAARNRTQKPNPEQESE